jgi:Zn-dependent peptidase ImmA (M78 family)
MINKKAYNLNKDYEDIIKKYHSKGFPIRIGKLAQEYGINLHEGDFPKGVSGQIYKENENYRIDVNKNDSFKRRRFTAAHELAHFFLHEDQIGDGIVDNAMYRSVLSNSTEVEANKLAADILMPMSKINELNGKSIGYLANYFEVSEQAMKVRLGIPF